MEFQISKNARLAAIVLIVLGLICFFIGYSMDHGEHASQRFWVNLLVNGYFYMGISLAALFFLALQYAAEVAWSVVVKRIFEAMISFLLPACAVIILVIVAGQMHWHHIYHWMDPDVYDVNSPHYDELIANKYAYLNMPFYWLRTIAYVAVWVFFANWFRKKSLEQDQLGGEQIHFRSIKMSVFFLIFFAYTSSSSAWDWIMSIDTHWFSTLFGWYCFSGMWVSAMIVSVVLVLYLKGKGLLKEVNENHIHDLGKWMFGISMLWCYLWFSQFMLIWYSDIPEEVTYYITRFEEYKALYLGTFAINFFFPFFVLMSRDAKRNPVFLLPVSLLIFVAHWMDIYVMIAPATLHGHGTHLGLMELGSFMLFLGTFVFTILNALSKRSLVPKSHPFLDESIHLHH